MNIKFLGIILRVVRLEVSIYAYNVYITKGVYAPAERADTLPLCLLYSSMYSVAVHVGVMSTTTHV
jgi:hypothetical protein